MAAIPFGAHQASRHRADREAGQQTVALDHAGCARAETFGPSPLLGAPHLLIIGWERVDKRVAA